MPGGSYFAFAIVAIIAVFFVVLAMGKYQTPSFIPVKVGTATINAEVADTQPKQVRGLMFRDGLPKDGGMLFVFDREARHGIWMMNVTFPIDIVWLDSDKKVVYVEHGAKPCEALMICPIYQPTSPAKYVLEVSSGYARSHSINVGKVAQFNLS